MKKLYYLIVLTVILGLVLTGCFLSNVGQVPTSEQSGITYLTKGGPQVVTLFAGKDEDVGTVTVSDNGTNLTVIYETNNGWEMTETHLYVGKTNPTELTSAPGQFPYSEPHSPITSKTYIIALSDISFYELGKGKKWVAIGSPGIEPGDSIFIAAHAKVVKITDELVANGGFELPDLQALVIPKTWAVFATGTTDLEWTVEPTEPPWDSGITEGLELQRLKSPHSEDQYAELDAYDPVRIYQDLSTWPEGRCTLTYAWSPRPGVSENIMEVWWNGAYLETHSADGSGNPDTVWEVEIQNDLVPNDNGQTRLEFVETGFDNQLGMFLDSVSVICVQEETAWAYGDRFTEQGNWATYFDYTIPRCWSLKGEWVITACIGSNCTFIHKMIITDDSFIGLDYYPLGNTNATGDIIYGIVTGNNVGWTNKTKVGGYEAYIVGTIADNGTMSGDWTDNSNQSGTWESTVGAASPIHCN